MRVCLDLSVLRTRPTGVGYYGLFLGKALLENFPQAQKYLAFDGLRFSRLQGFINRYERQSALKTEISHSLWEATAPVPMLRGAWRRLKGFAFSRGASACDLVHSITYAPPVRGATAWLPVIHDLSHLRFPQFHPAERIRWLTAHDAALGEAVLINTVSEFSKNEIVSLLGIAPDRIRITYPGTDPAFALPPSEEGARILSRYGLKAGRFLLSVATINPRKNLGTIAAAFAQLPQTIRDETVLVFAGQSGWERVEFSKAATRLRERGEIGFIGYVPTDHLRALYHNTSLFLFPSHYEGFGIPVAEAHLAGAPVAIAKGAGAREAACGLALEIAVTDVDGWSQAMREALGSEAWRDENARAARTAAAKQFTWRRNAQLTFDIYAEIARQHHAG